MRRRLGAALAAAMILVAMAAGIWWYFRPPAAKAPEPPAAERLVPRLASFADLPGWDDDAMGDALAAFRRSCTVLQRLPADRDLGIGGRAGDWREVCIAARAETAAAAPAAFFQSHFQPFAATNNGTAEGLFTGYYEASLRGSRNRAGPFQVPLYLRPPDLVTVDLGQFRDQLKGQRIAGRVLDGALRPFESRAEIERGALAGKGLELVWVDDAVDAFFLHIQGSGRVELDDGGTLRIGYAAQNGHPYVAIGRHLIERGALAREAVSMQSIRAWLAANPGEAAAVMALNPSYVFFRQLDGDGPLGAQGVALTPGRSLAVDRGFLPLGAPVWIDAMHPAAKDGDPDQPLRRLLVAQDTGGAIRGPVRGDVFWGHGPEAEAIAGRMKHAGRYWLLLPRPVAARIAAAG